MRIKRPYYLLLVALVLILPATMAMADDDSGSVFDVPAVESVEDEKPSEVAVQEIVKKGCNNSLCDGDCECGDNCRCVPGNSCTDNSELKEMAAVGVSQFDSETIQEVDRQRKRIADLEAAVKTKATNAGRSVFDETDLRSDLDEQTKRIDSLMEWSRKTAKYLDDDRADEDARIEKVVRRVLGELNVTIRGANGQTRQQTVPVGSNFQGSFTLSDGDCVSGYCDPLSGQQVVLPAPQYRQTTSGMPVRVYDDPFMQMRATNGRAGFQVRSRPMFEWLGRSGQASSCRMVNGQMRCN